MKQISLGSSGFKRRSKRTRKQILFQVMERDVPWTKEALHDVSVYRDVADLDIGINHPPDKSAIPRFGCGASPATHEVD